jgi:AraC-like DNA-binding protein
VTVTDYLKAVRLDAAYRDLIAAHPSRDTVTTIALRNGCRHLGRFSSEFRERFGQLPRETLRSEPSAFGQLRGGPQPISPCQLMQRAAGSVEPESRMGSEHI